MNCSTSVNKSIFDNLQLYLSMFRYAAAHNDDFAREQYSSYLEMLKRLESYDISSVEGLRTLDVGCGKSMWLSLLLNTDGANITGIDTEVVDSSGGLKKYLKILKQNGIERTARTLVWEIFYARPYYKKLAEVSNRKLVHKGLDARQGDATKLEFADNTFDLVVSHEVFEHIPDIPATAKELNRVMKPDAITHIYVHNYCSISGGHHIAWKYPDKEPSETVPAWDHLRDNKHPHIPSWINRLRMQEYKKAFEEYFEILDWVHTEKEGEKLLTDEIKQELSEYSEEELLTKGFIIIAKPKK